MGDRVLAGARVEHAVGGRGAEVLLEPGPFGVELLAAVQDVIDDGPLHAAVLGLACGVMPISSKWPALDALGPAASRPLSTAPRCSNASLLLAAIQHPKSSVIGKIAPP